MANDVENILCITALTPTGNDELKKFIAAVDKPREGEEDDHFVFDELYPMPEEIRNTTDSLKVVSDKEWNKKRKSKETDAVGQPIWQSYIGRTENKRRMKAYGVNNWYDWACKFWGTKWGAYNCSPWERNTSQKLHVAHTFFNTAWDPPTAFFLKVSKDFPNLHFHLVYVEEGNQIAGEAKIRKGKAISGGNYEWESNKGVRIRNAHGCGPEDDGYAEE